MLSNVIVCYRAILAKSVCGIVGNTKSVNNVAYKSFIVKLISVNKPSSVPAVQTRNKSLNKKCWKNWNRNGLLKTEIEENKESKKYCP